MTSRNGAGPPPGQSGRYLPSPRRQNAVRLPTSVPATSASTAVRRDSGLNYSNSAGPPVIDDINPKIAEIQLRVEELVRRYDDAVAAVDHEEEDDAFGDKPTRTPARWRVGDVLLATHRSLARTSTHTERTMISEFGDDPEVNNAIGSGAQKVGDAFTEASEQATRRHQRLSHIHQALQSAAANVFSLDDSEEDEEEEQMSSYSSRERQLRSTIDALHREKDSMASQLEEALRMQQDARVAIEQQAQELTKAQRQLRALVEELRSSREHNEKSAEAANALTASWREKFQASAKAAASAEAKVHELEAKVRTQSEEIVKHTFVLQAKSQEMERLKESEAARSRAEAAAHAAALSEAEEATRRAKAKAVEAKRKSKLSADEGNKDFREMEDKIRELEGTLLAAENVKQGLETENADLSRRFRELQARFGEQRKLKLKDEGEKQSETVSTFALRLRENSPGVNTRKRQRGGVVAKPTSSGDSKPTLTAPPTPVKSDDELSSGESEPDSDTEDVDEVERDEREMNHVLKLVVATVFPVFSPPEESDDMIDDCIAQYEDPNRSPLNEIQPSQVEAASVLSSDEDLVDRSELDKLRLVYDHEVDALKQQYVDGLQEYKRLVIEQYGRRQAIERERHRLEIEGLLRLIQTKFHAELSRRSERLKQAKESLKELYNALRQHAGPATEPEDYDEDVSQPYNAAMPLKTLLRAAILAMSTSAKRNGRGRTQIEAIHEQLTKILPPPDPRTSAVAAAMTIHTAIRTIKPQNTVELVDNWSQTDILPVPRERSTEIVTVEQRVAPESLDGYVLPGSPYFPPGKSTGRKQELVVVTGILISSALMAELRQLLPNLPPGNYYVSSALRLALFRELVRFYAAVEMQLEAHKPRPSAKIDDTIHDADVVIGSPRDTPFLRRKALETIENKARQRNRRHLFSSGGTAILQTTFTSTSPSSR